jgi:tRNA U38,U39,U40 pseudouridine synthase TruA
MVISMFQALILLFVVPIYSLLSNTKMSISRISNQKNDIVTDLTADADGIITLMSSSSSSSDNPVEHNSNQCKFCGNLFSSRNQVFRHLRDSNCHFLQSKSIDGGNDNDNDNDNNIPLPPSGTSLPKQSIAIRFGYYYYHDDDDDDDNDNHNSNANSAASSTRFQGGINEIAVEIIRKAFDVSRKAYDLSKSEGNYATSARSRNMALTQDKLCCAASDVLVISYRASSIFKYESLVNMMNDRIQRLSTKETKGIVVRVLDINLTTISSKFHAEKDCTQRVYHYLLPLRWLRDFSDAEQWLVQRFRYEQSPIDSNHNSSFSKQEETSSKTPLILTKLKENLCLACSRTASNRKERRNEKKDVNGQDSVKSPSESHLSHKFVTSPGRYGALWKKERRCLHNFADPNLRGLASPNSETVWRCIDRAGIIDVIIDNIESTTGNKKPSLTLVIELRGDSFLTGEVNRIIGSTVAICNGWLPLNFWQFATRPDVILETPTAPDGRSYLSSARYHHLEVRKGFDVFNIQTENSCKWLKELQNHLMEVNNDPKVMLAENDWLTNLENCLAIGIRSQMEKIVMDDNFRDLKAKECESKLVGLSNVSKIYEKTLGLLRELVQSERWPPTSQARSRVIRKSASQSHILDTNIDYNNQSGSFTVVNEALYSGTIPRANVNFPELTKAVFELEGFICKDFPLKAAEGAFQGQIRPLPRLRKPSTHCAINRNAEFMPHVDSGRGEGQSLSLIVGLGNFDRGEIVVEGRAYPIRYQPLEFDGWNQIHYTEPFDGNERFTLVWFTPEKRQFGYSV